MDIKEQILQYISTEYDCFKKNPWAKYPEYTTFTDKLSGKWFCVLMDVDYNKLGIKKSGRCYVIDLKADPVMIPELIKKSGIMPGYHMNKNHWISVLLDGSIPINDIKPLIDNSFTLITDSPTRRIYEAVMKIPRGKVATYGDIAALAGNPAMSRAVGNALHKNPDENNIPCFRVVNSKGELSGAFAFGGLDEQKNRLEADGIEVADGRVDLDKYRIDINLIQD